MSTLDKILMWAAILIVGTVVPLLVWSWILN